MALPLRNTAEGGTNTTQVSTGNSGGSSGDAFDAVNASGGNPSFSNTHAAHGSLAFKFGAAVTNTFTWNTFGTITEIYGRVYLYATANPTANLNILNFLSSATSQAQVTITTTGKIRERDAAGNTNDGSVSIGLNAWIRIEYHIVFNGSTGSIEVKLFNTAESTSPDETLTWTSRNTGASADQARFGNVNGASGTAFWLDSLLINATGYPGPFVDERFGTFALTGGGDLAASGAGVHVGTFALTGGGDLAVDGGAGKSGVFALTGGGDLWVQGTASGTANPRPTTLYVLKTRNRDGSGEMEIPVYDLQFSEVLSNTPTCTFKVFADVAADLASALEPLKRIVYIYRNGDLVWSGPLYSLHPEVSGEEQVVSFDARGWLEELRRRIRRPEDGTLTFTSMSPWDMADAVIAYANSQYDTGITPGDRFGSPPTPRDAQYNPWQTVVDILADIASLPDRDFDYWVDQFQAWNVVRRRTAPISSLDLGPYIETMAYEKSGDSVGTDVYATGGGTGADALYGHDQGSATARGLQTEVFPKNEQETVQSYLDEGATNYLFYHERPQILVESVDINMDGLAWGDIVIGTWHPLTYSDRFVNIVPTTPPHPDLVRPVGYFRVVSRNVNWQDSGKDKVNLMLDQAIF